MKKSWKKPELIVLVRSKPEEAVLTGCKAMDTLSGGAISDAGRLNGMCYGESRGGGPVTCSAVVAS